MKSPIWKWSQSKSIVNSLSSVKYELMYNAKIVMCHVIAQFTIISLYFEISTLFIKFSI